MLSRNLQQRMKPKAIASIANSNVTEHAIPSESTMKGVAKMSENKKIGRGSPTKIVKMLIPCAADTTMSPHPFL